MRSWIDVKGREWKLALTIGKLKEVKDELEIDLLENPLDPRLEDLVSLINVVYIVVRGQHDLGPVEFGETLTTEGLEHLMKSFWEEYTDFFLVARPEWGVAILAGQIESGVRNLETLFKVLEMFGENVSCLEERLRSIHETTPSKNSCGSAKEHSHKSPADLLRELQKVKM
jgi:hypothetical protein